MAARDGWRVLLENEPALDLPSCIEPLILRCPFQAPTVAGAPVAILPLYLTGAKRLSPAGVVGAGRVPEW